MKKVLLIIVVAVLCSGSIAFGQGGNPGNISLAGGFLGFDGTGLSQALQVRNDFNRQIEWHTNSTRRMLMNPALTGQIVNVQFPVPMTLTGYVGVGQFANGAMDFKTPWFVCIPMVGLA